MSGWYRKREGVPMPNPSLEREGERLIWSVFGQYGCRDGAVQLLEEHPGRSGESAGG